MPNRIGLGRFAVLAGVCLILPPVVSYADVNVKACAAEPATTDIADGDLVNCEINPVGDSDLFRFSGQAGDLYEVWVLRYTAAANLCVRLIDSSGTPGTYSCISGFREASLSVGYTLSASGVYTLQVADAGNDETCTYGIAVHRLFPPSRFTPIEFGRVVPGSINPRGDTDFYSFQGQIGSTISVTVSRLTGSANQCVRIIDVDGKVGSPACVSGFREVATVLETKIAKSGLHTIQIFDAGLDETLDYNMDVECFGNCATASIPATNCGYSLAPANRIFSSAAGTGTIGIVTGANCPWAVSNPSNFVTVTSATTGTGTGVVNYSVAANTAAATRTANVTIGGQNATITQSGTAPLLTLNPASLALTWRQGSTLPPDSLVSVFTNAAALPFTASVNPGANWLTVTPASGTAPALLFLSVNPSSLAPGTYSGAVTVNAPSANPASQTITVSLTVEAAGVPKLSVESDALNFAFALGSQGRTERRTVTNLGSGTLAFQVASTTATGGQWLSATPDRGQATLASPASLTLTVDPTGLDVGTYSGTVTITAGSDKKELPVTISVSSVTQAILLSQSGLTFTAVAAGGGVPPQTFGVLNTGHGVMDWSASTNTISGDTNWLSVSPSTGSTDADSLSIPIVTVSVDPNGLAPGDYYGQVVVESTTASNSPQSISVVLTVLPPGSDPGPVVRPTGLIFTAVAGAGQPAAQTVEISNLTGSTRSFTSGKLTTDGANWFAVQPAAATVAPGQTTTINISTGSTGLVPGIRRGVLTLLFQDGAVRNINVLFVLVAAASSSQAGKHPAAAGCTPTRLLPLITSMGSDFVVPAGWPNSVEARVVDDCGNAMTSGSVVSTFSNGDPPLPLVSLKDGRWTGTWQARNTSVPQVTVSLTAEIPAQSIKGVTQVTGGLRSNADAPSLGSGGVVSLVNGAQSPLAPGSVVAILGSQLSQGQALSDQLPLETKLAGTQVVIGGRLMPLLAAGETQVNAIVPFGLPTNTQQQLVLQRGNTYTVPQAVTIAAAQPAIYTKDNTGKGQGAITDSNGNLAAPGNPVAAGAAIVISCAGLGEVDPPVPAGTSAPSPMARVTSPVSLTIGGVPATIQSAGLAPGMAGVYQVNATVPDGIASGDQVPVVITVSGQSSAPVTMAIQ